MKSASGAHFIALDHVRAVAVLLVFVWHFVHGRNGYPSPFEGAPFWGPLVLFDEGHVGVSLFMTLSGYLFAKLLDGNRIRYLYFVWNRILRLFPLLILVMIANAIMSAVKARNWAAGYWYLLSMPSGLVLPTWPNGGWSITAELHFYLTLPALLYLRRKASILLVGILVLTIALRYCLYREAGEVQSLAYWTIVGRIDQFVLGILAFHHRRIITHRHTAVLTITIAFISIYYYFDVQGGFYHFGGYPSPSSIWVVLPTIDGIAFASAIAWYDTSFAHTRGKFSTALSKVGEYSYSIYLLHFFIVFHAARWIGTYLLDISSFYRAFLFSLLVFVSLLPIGYLSMRFIERPFLRFRRDYRVKVEMK